MSIWNLKLWETEDIVPVGVESGQVVENWRSAGTYAAVGVFVGGGVGLFVVGEVGEVGAAVVGNIVGVKVVGGRVVGAEVGGGGGSRERVNPVPLMTFPEVKVIYLHMLEIFIAQHNLFSSRNREREKRRNKILE
jgi:hypothetical protein